MALKRLTTAEMISLSSPWVKGDHDERKALSEIDDTKPVLRRIETAHAAILASQPKGAQSGVLAAIQEATALLDNEHDDVVRGTLFVLNGHALLQSDRAQRDALLKLKDFLFPTGPSSTQRSCREEAGQAELLKGRLNPPMKALLKSVPSPDGHLLTTVQRYLRVAQKLGATSHAVAEDRKSAARAETSGDGAALVKARNKWIRAVNVLIATLEQEDIESPWAGTILERIRQAEAAAERRVESDGPPSESLPGPDEPPAPAPA